MTIIDRHQVSRPVVNTAALKIFAMVLVGFIISGQAGTISGQSKIIETQHKIISEMSSSTFNDGEYKFASGFLTACGNPCVIRDNPGGGLKDYEWLASLVNVREQTILIDGYCASACALFADQARSYVRITDRASFWFHQTSDGNDPPHSPDIAAWVQANGGYPTQASGDLTKMGFDTARRFWQPVFDGQRIPFDLDTPYRVRLATNPFEIVAGLRGTVQ